MPINRRGQRKSSEISNRFLPDDALVVRGGAEHSASRIAAGTDRHPSGIRGFSVESAAGLTLEELCRNIPNSQVGVTTAGKIRSHGGDVIPTSGVSPNHATVTGLNPEVASILLSPSQLNPVPKQERMQGLGIRKKQT